MYKKYIYLTKWAPASSQVRIVNVINKHLEQKKGLFPR